MKNKIRKAFTLVELLVVIAIIAVLAVVGIVSYSAFTKKAELSNDVGLITQINTVLQADEAGEGKNKTFHDVRADVLENGIDLAKINLSSKDFRLAWDSKQDRVVLLDGDKVAVAPDDYVGQTGADMKEMFIVAKNSDNVTGETVFNFYLPDDFTVPENTLDVAVGIDVGNNVNININYKATGDGTRIFNTNGGTLTVNNPQSTIEHYGSANKAVITATAAESYHCHAIIAGSIDVAQGHVVVENTAEVPLINVVKSENTEAKVSLTYQPEARQDIPVMVAEGVDAETVLKDESGNSTVPSTAADNMVDLNSFAENIVAISNSMHKNHPSYDANRTMQQYTADDFSGVTSYDLTPLYVGHCIKNGTTEITLLKDVEVKNYLQLGYSSATGTYDVILNLNGHKLTFADGAVPSGTAKGGPFEICIFAGANGKINLTVKNGEIENLSNNQYGNGFDVYDHCSLTLEDVTYTGGRCQVYLQGLDATVKAKNCTMNSDEFCITTNVKSNDHWDVKMDIENSNITAEGTAVLLNIPGTLDVKNSKLYGSCQAAFVRGGDATFTNCELINTAEEHDAQYEYSDSQWSDGNKANFAALTVGNKSTETDYHNPVNVTLIG